MSIGFKRMGEVRVLDLVDVGAPCLASHARGRGAVGCYQLSHVFEAGALICSDQVLLVGRAERTWYSFMSRTLQRSNS